MTSTIDSVFITGANRGIGLELVKQLLGNSPKFPKYVFATCRNVTEATELNSLASQHKSLHVIPMTDVRDYASYDAIVKNVETVVGSGGLNVLINNAGVALKDPGLEGVTRDEMVETFEINAVAPLLLSKAFLPLLKQAALKYSTYPMSCSRAAIVNVTSQMGSIADNKLGSFYAYRSSKVALNMITQSLHLDLKNDKILVVAIHPGWVQTDLGGSNATTTVTDSARSILKTVFALGEENGGQFLNRDGSIIPW